jgi:hypothetical protein
MPSVIPPPVQVGFSSLYRPDMPALAQSLIPFGRWNEDSIARGLPVVVSYPPEISQRLEVLTKYLSAGGWPPELHPGAIGTIAAVIEQMMPHVEAEIAQAVRLMTAAAIRDDGSRATQVRDQVLSSFLASKMLATARAFLGNQPIGEPPLDWGAEFYEMETVSSSRLINGLSFLARDRHGWAGWSDADLHLNAQKYRIFVPICPKPPDTIDVEKFAAEDVRELIIPQLLSSNSNVKERVLAIRRLALEPWETSSKDLVMRDEVFADAETCCSHQRAKAYLTRIAADRIVSYLQEIPSKERWGRLLNLTMSLGSIGFDIAGQVREKLQVG